MIEMDRYQKTFSELKKKKVGAFVPFVMLGDPDERTSFEIVKTLLENGADVLELGMPFSDPIADGPTIQAADQRALAKKFNIVKALSLIKKIRKLDGHVPIGLLVYSNLINSFGTEKFYASAKEAGVDGVLCADVPFEEAGPFLKASKKSGICQIFLVAPTTTTARMRKIFPVAKGFVYAVSLLGVTGTRKKLGNEVFGLIKNAKKQTKLPVCVGFGISEPGHIKELLAAGADGAIIGSAIVKIIERNAKNRKKMIKEIAHFCRKMKKATV
jgi:tryptophan synthase alpha chain